MLIYMQINQKQPNIFFHKYLIKTAATVHNLPNLCTQWWIFPVYLFPELEEATKSTAPQMPGTSSSRQQTIDNEKLLSETYYR